VSGMQKETRSSPLGGAASAIASHWVGCCLLRAAGRFASLSRGQFLCGGARYEFE
jgi:hypothetical protein